MNAWAVTAVTVAILAGYAIAVRLIGNAARNATPASPTLPTVVDHPSRAAFRRGQRDYAQLIVWELAQHGHNVQLVDFLDCLASTRLALKDDIDGTAVDAYYHVVLGGDAS